MTFLGVALSVALFSFWSTRMPNEIDDLITAAGQPLRVQTDAGEVEQQPLRDRIELLRLQQATTSAASARSAGRAVGWASACAGRVVPPGA